MNSTICLIESKLRRELRDATEGKNGKVPADSPALLVTLNNHRRSCYSCKGGVMPPLYAEWFGGLRVEVSHGG